MTLEDAKKMYKKILRTCESDTETLAEVDDAIKTLKQCVSDMKAELKKCKKDDLRDGKLKYAAKPFIPFNGVYRFFKRHDSVAGKAFLAEFIPYVGGIVEIGLRYTKYEDMLEDCIDNTEDAIDFLEDKKKELKKQPAATRVTVRNVK